MPPQRTALIVGATGLVGRAVLARLLADPLYAQIRIISRRALVHNEARLDLRVLPFDQLDALANNEPDFFAVDDVFCCLGTTLKTAGSKTAFARVDRGYVQVIANATAGAGATRFGLVSALGANPHSRVFYSRIKGEAEAGVMAAGFGTVCIVRPSLLLGQRNEHRAGEAAAQRIMPLFKPLLRGPARRLQPVPADAVARHLVSALAQPQAGVHISYPTT